MTTLKIIQNGENKKVEFKEKMPSKDNLIKTIIAFANTAGGKLFIGIQDKTKEIVGISNSDIIELPDIISNIVYDSCSPVIIPEIYSENVKNKNILIIEVFPGMSKPYYIKKKGKLNGTYVRVGATNRLADGETLLELERQRRNISFDEEIAYDHSLEDLDIIKLKQFFFSKTNINLKKEDLLNLKIFKEEKDKIYPTVGGLLLAGKENLFEYARISCARFKGTTTNEFIDRKEILGTLCEQVEEIMKFAKVYIARSAKIEDIQRIDRYEVPLIAIREAIINAVVHRDYSISGSDIKFAVFDDVIEITSPGSLPRTLDIEDMKRGRSEIRNKVIARFFKEIGFIEQWGTGIKKIICSCEEENLKTPDFFEPGNFFQVVIYKEKISDSNSPIPDKFPIQDKIPDKFPINNNNIADKMNCLLEYIKQTGEITNQKGREITGLNSEQLKYIFQKLVQENKLIKVGDKKNTKYILFNQD